MTAKTILVIDDEKHIAHVLAYKIRQAGYEVITAGDGQEGYALACEHRPSLIVTDFQMPNLDGFEMCVKLHEDESTCEIPVIMLTARGHRLHPSEMLKPNIQCLMQKPFSAHELLERIAEFLPYDKDDTCEKVA